MVAVFGSYMSRRDQLPELSLSLVLDRRPVARASPARAPQNKEDAYRQIKHAVTELSSFIVVRLIEDRQAIPRPFSVVFRPPKT